ncbi:ECF RNA polymerase sigma factor SigE [mine drainage metagenome]|uniref:ECF RNA polymerase sigma factor SigE n=1 Tax=mine drainage metagenome TaxID=410659 RepID=A0A1J5R347_9ZZZZ
MAAWQNLLEELVRERRPMLIGYAALLTGSRDEAEDLVHDAIVRTFGRPRSFPNLNAADAYVRRAIASAFIDRVRSKRSWRVAMPRLVAGAAAPEDVAARLDVRAALLTLPRRERTCVVMRYLSDGIHHLNAELGTAADPDAEDTPVAVMHVTREGPGR